MAVTPTAHQEVDVLKVLLIIAVIAVIVFVVLPKMRNR